ncbi:hypothetical protein H6801_04120 [Candidatus Nomurabacteria bacterium]|nr:hypothetical protein [Candidatus Saccharibacteria bacterium]MCB9822521.1 hypothetical protein [Candidatus Nomurabacteria bacterium]
MSSKIYLAQKNNRLIILVVSFCAAMITIFFGPNTVYGAESNCRRENFANDDAFKSCVLEEAQDTIDNARNIAVGENTVSTGACRPGSGSLTSAVFVPWYKYLDGEVVDGKCTPAFPKTSKSNYDFGKGVPLILIAIIELLLRISGLIAIGFGIYGSIRYIMSQGQPESLKGAKATITNAIVGLVIVLVATGFVQFIGNVFK